MAVKQKNCAIHSLILGNMVTKNLSLIGYVEGKQGKAGRQGRQVTMALCNTQTQKAASKSHALRGSHAGS